MGTVVYDANVLHSRAGRYLLLGLVRLGMARAVFGDTQFFEAFGSVAARQRWDSLDDLLALVRSMQDAVRTQTVKNYKRWDAHITGMNDRGDRMILALAIQGGATLIVTENLRDFPANSLNPWGVQAEGLDDFLNRCIDLNAAMVVMLTEDHPHGASNYLGGLAKAAPRAAGRIRGLLGR